MNQSQRRMIRYAVAEVCVLALLIFVCRVALREPPVDTSEHPAMVATAPPRTPHVIPSFSLAHDSSPEAAVNRLDESGMTNAAAIYRQAFALYDALSDEQKEVVGNWRTNVDASVEAELCEKIQPICELMHQATALTNCDWGVEQPITFSTPLRHLAPCRSIARAAVWSAAHCRTDDPSAAIDDLVASSRLGQNMSPWLIDHLVDLAIQNEVIDCVAEHASSLAGAGNSRLNQLFGNTPYEEKLSHAFEQEIDVTSRKVDELAEKPPEEAIRLLAKITEHDTEELRSIELTQAITDLRQVVELGREYVKALELPKAEYNEWLTQLDAIAKTNPFVRYLTVMETTVIRTDSVTIRDAMVVAGLAVIRDGVEALQSHPDPATGQPFVYTQTADGFELQSSYQFLGRPLKVSFK